MTGTIDGEVATIGHLTGHEVVGSVAEVGLLALSAKTEGEVGSHRLVVEGSQFVLVAALAVVADGHAVDIHLTARLHDAGEGSGLTFIFEFGYTAVGIRFGRQRTDGLTGLCIDNGDVSTIAVLAVDDGDRGIATNHQVDLLAVVESPSVRSVVVVSLVAHDLNALMIGRIEVDICEVVRVGGCGSRKLNSCGNGIERQIALYQVFHFIFLATLGLGEPATEGATIESCDVINTKGKLANGLLALDCLGTDNGRTVEIIIGEGVLSVESCDLLFCQGTDGHEGTIVHTSDG